MSEYKSVRLEEKVYNRLQELQQVRESLSQTLARILQERTEIINVSQEVMRILDRGP